MYIRALNSQEHYSIFSLGREGGKKSFKIPPNPRLRLMHGRPSAGAWPRSGFLSRLFPSFLYILLLSYYTLAECILVRLLGLVLHSRIQADRSTLILIVLLHCWFHFHVRLLGRVVLPHIKIDMRRKRRQRRIDIYIFKIKKYRNRARLCTCQYIKHRYIAALTSLTSDDLWDSFAPLKLKGLTSFPEDKRREKLLKVARRVSPVQQKLLKNWELDLVRLITWESLWSCDIGFFFFLFVCLSGD